MTIPMDTVLITGAGSDMAIAIANIIRENGYAKKIIGADANDDQPGFAFYDAIHRLPKATEPDFLSELDALTAKYDPRLIIPMSEAELKTLLLEERIDIEKNRRVVTANKQALEIGLDKWNTFNFLRKHGLPTPQSGIIGQSKPDKLPCIIKMRQGQGSKGIVIAEDWSIEHHLTMRDGDLWQDFLPDSDSEFTCGVCRYPGVKTRSILLRRRLQGGATGSGIVEEHDVVSTILEQIAEKLDLVGAINVQLRMKDNKPYIFEINPRFSSTVGFRHRMGFQDFLWSIEYALGLPISEYTPPPPGTQIYRVGQEIIRYPD